MIFDFWLMLSVKLCNAEWLSTLTGQRDGGAVQIDSQQDQRQAGRHNRRWGKNLQHKTVESINILYYFNTRELQKHRNKNHMYNQIFNPTLHRWNNKKKIIIVNITGQQLLGSVD